MRKTALAVLVMLALTGCGPYAAAFTPSEPLPSAEELAGTWQSKDGAEIALSEDGRFEVRDVPADYLPTGDGTGTWTAPEQDPTPFPLLKLRYDNGDYAELYHQFGSVFGDESVYFSDGVVDDADWFRLYREE